MNGDDVAVLTAVDALADGTSIARPSSTGNDAGAGTLEALRIIDRIAQVHRQVLEEVPAVGGAGLGPATPLAQGDARHFTRQSREGHDDSVAPWRWGPLVVHEYLGGGSFGRVYRAWDPGLEHEVALKLQPASPRALRDGQLATRVKHPNVITVHGAADIDGEVGIWMDLVHGRTLEQLGDAVGTLSAAEAILVGESLCAALGAVHAVGLIHRDIKATNVMREDGGRLIVIDFGTGVEHEIETAERSGDVAGTPLYMAPEVLAGARATPRSDIYSLGVLLFYLVTRTYPVSGRALSELRHAHLTGRRRLLSDVRPDLPRSFVAAVERALCPDPKDRYQTVGEMLRALTAQEFQAPEPSPIPLERYLLVSIVTVVLFATAMGGLTLAAFNQAFLRGDFAAESPGEWVVTGFKSMFGPVVRVALLLTAAFIASAAGWWSFRLLSRLRTLGRQTVFRRAAARWESLDANALGVGLVAAGAGLLFAALWYFQPILAVTLGDLSDASAEQLALLSPARADYHNRYRSAFVAIASLLIGGGLLVWRFARRRRQSLHAGCPIAIGALTFLAVASLSLPYQLVFHSEFERAILNGERCYITGENEQQVLLFCPWRDGAAEPRSQIASRFAPELRRLSGPRVPVFCDSPDSFDKGLTVCP